MLNKIITRIQGGLGNQLFCYAAARRLALLNNAELVLDDVTGFIRDTQYYRTYMLDKFRIPARKATASERLEPFERYRRALMKFSSRWKSFTKRSYIEQKDLDFDSRLLELNFRGTLYLDGLWQSERYFKDVEATIREDLRIISPEDETNLRLRSEINGLCSAVAIHVRWFDGKGTKVSHNASAEYYQRAIEIMNSKIDLPYYFLFSDDPEAAINKLNFKNDRMTCVTHNRGDDRAYGDLWLMTQCRHFITANSTFSWWGAWLNEHRDKIVIAPNLSIKGKTAWGFKGLIPDEWLKV